jgi:hypothetical protein
MDRCRICLEPSKGQLSREHLPPRSCGNKGRKSVVTVECIFRGARAPQVFQNGVTRRSICKQCNSHAGSHYVPSLEKWYKAARDNLGNPRGPLDDRTLALPTRPLAVTKQIAAMWLALTTPTQCSDAVEFARIFVRIPKMVVTNPPWRMFVYLHVGSPCAEGMMGTITMTGRKFVTLSQVGLFPLGFLVLPNEEWTKVFSVETGLTDITHFCGLSPETEFTHHLRLRPWMGLMEQMKHAEQRNRD